MVQSLLCCPGAQPELGILPHVALYLSFIPLTSRGLALVFHDEHIDLAIYAGDRLLVYIEVKEKAEKLQALMAGIKDTKQQLTCLPPIGNDPLRKAKCIINGRPDYFCGYAIGARFDYKANVSNNSFRLKQTSFPGCKSIARRPFAVSERFFNNTIDDLIA